MWRKALFVAFLLLLTSVVIAQPALAQNPIWHGTYFNNPNLSGNPVFARDDGNIAFNWGAGSPGSGINPDNFSVRWGADVQLSPGTYRFYAQADDNIRIIFNFGFQPIIDTFASGQVNQLVTADVNVPAAGTYHIQVDYRELTDQAFAFVSFANLATNPTGPSFPAPSNPVQVPMSAWTAQYYSNVGLLGDPVAIVSEPSPTHDWGSGSPMSTVPADNFSVRWTSIQNLAGGAYTISASADDGVRVFVNGNLVINEWHPASGQTYSTSVNLTPGQNYFQVEYYEATGEARITFNITQTTPGSTPVSPPQQPPAPTGATATVLAFRLNVRALPDPINGQIITRVNRNETYPVLGRNADTTWFLISVNGTNGWVSGAFVAVNNGFNVPVVGAQQQPVPPSQPQPPVVTGAIATATPFNVVIRSGPGTQFARLAVFPVGMTAQVVGRNASNTWWQINFNGIVGWSSAQFAVISPTTNVNSIPVTG